MFLECNLIEIDNKEKASLIIASLLHNIGHTPYSHVFDESLRTDETIQIHLKKNIGNNHEIIGIRLLNQSNSSLNQLIIANENIVDLDWICVFAFSEIIKKNSIILSDFGCTTNKPPNEYLSVLISNKSLDLDRLDYICRDTFYCFHENIFPNFNLIQDLLDSVCFDENHNLMFNIDTEEKFKNLQILIERYLDLWNNVYMHPTNRFIQIRYAEIISEYISHGFIDIYSLIYLFDQDLISELKQIEYPDYKDIIFNLENIRLSPVITITIDPNNVDLRQIENSSNYLDILKKWLIYKLYIPELKLDIPFSTEFEDKFKNLRITPLEYNLSIKELIHSKYIEMVKINFFGNLVRENRLHYFKKMIL